MFSLVYYKILGFLFSSSCYLSFFSFFFLFFFFSFFFFWGGGGEGREDGGIKINK